ncbi:SDR family NAD(P)-dependent oxidoreductase [Caenimonas sedimenti]|uniref:SDR family NAD(P)-dependent oxidoreductase n=1 Tax=Caenimonas sedimenti TaxID=2596921 RepID=A0A562ZQ67_9BURK|nr:SDR family NAD(P)-dependent oxidoreductase [Caenimonas sedimenti]TWO70547.1 SDR family NAD(P)-dependent oxidoreductase [Caenimonas sedimenti]
MQSIQGTVVIVGATSSIAEHCARLWLQRGATHLVLVGRDAARTEHLATDLRVRGPQARIDVVTADLLEPAAVRETVSGLLATGNVPATVLIAHGSLPDQAACQQDLDSAAEAMRVNAISPVLFAEAFAGAMQAAGRGRIGIIGSVAGDRGRKSNYVYGAAKGLVTRYAQGLQHRLAATPVTVTLVKPGPTDTPMTAHLKAQGAKLADVSAVAAAIVDGIERGAPVVYAPAKWALIMMVIRHLPRFVFNKMDI